MTMRIQATSTSEAFIPGHDYLTSLARQSPISKEATKRLRWFDYYARCGNGGKTCRYFGISAQTFYRWKHRFGRDDLTTLESASRRPHHVRQPQPPVRVVERIQELREQYSRWGKDKLAVLVSRERIKLQASSLGRVMNKLKARGLLGEPVNVGQAKLARKRRWKPR